MYSLLIASIAKPFIATTAYTTYYPLFFALFLSSILNFTKLKRKYKIGFIIVGSIYLLFVYTNVDNLELRSWVLFIISDLRQKIGAFVTRKLILIPQEVGLVATYFIISISTTLINKKVSFWKPFVVAYVCFYLLLSAFLKIQFREATLITLMLGLCISLVESYKSDAYHKKQKSLLALIVLILISFFGFNYNNYYATIQHKLIESSIVLRSDLSSKNFYERFNLKNRNSSPSKSGYSDDSSHLGGPMYMDYSPVFVVKETTPTYWRVDSKYIYNGLGWSNSKEQLHEKSNLLPETFGKETLNPSAAESHQVLESAKGVSFLPIPLGQSQISQPLEIEHTQSSNKLLSSYELDGIKFDSLELNKLSNLTFETRSPLRNKDILNEVMSSNKSLEFVKNITSRSIPNSVKNLALEVTDSGETMYEKALLLENYLKYSKEFKYSLSDVPYVPKDMNYVEHFLFTSKIGYCEHFASSFVVMAQSIGIPTRYSKGFSNGTSFEEITTIRNSDAHAWPEVYFEEYGWIPFEPTPSFSIGNQIEETNQIELPTTLPSTEDIPSNKPTIDNDSTVINPSTNTEIDVIKDQKSVNYAAVLGIVATGILVILISNYRKDIHRLLLTRKLKSKKHRFTQAFDILVTAIEIFYPRPTSTLISEHLRDLPANMSEDALRLLIKYEEIVYGQAGDDMLSPIELRQLLDILKKLRKKTDD